MTESNSAVKLVAAAAAGSTILVFAQVTLAVLIPAVVGIALILLGIGIAYRTPAFIGLLAVLTTMAFSIEVPTLTDTEGVLRAAISVFAPTVTITWAAMSSEPGDERAIGPGTRPTAVLLGTATILLMTVPLFVFLVGVFIPTVSIRVSTMAEISVLLVSVTASAMLLTRSTPRRMTAAVNEERAPEEAP